MTASTTAPALSFNGVHKSYARAASPALSAFTLTVNAGECHGLVGANGAGKTTLIKCLLDFCEPDAGAIGIFGVPHRLTASRARLAYLPERFNPPHYLSGRDFLRFMARMHRGAYDEGAAVAMAQALDLDTAALNKPVRAYSKGMNQKLGLAACLLSRKDLFILDEPTSGLDPRARILLKRKLKTLREHGKTIFFTSHALADVEEMCDRVAVIDGGQLKFTGTPADLIRAQNAANMEQAFMALTAIEPTSERAS
ncbi:MAG: ABC transporter ATP-binding protein [Betaproteobacteria bacterium]|nr:ABC transporter ATP-binding protein [Betaproteobacteria bacterium]